MSKTRQLRRADAALERAHDLEKECRGLREQLQVQQHENTKHRRTIADLENTIKAERVIRVSAQRGLIPYVRFVQWLNGWMEANREEPVAALLPLLEAASMRGVKVGYDPDHDPVVQQDIAEGRIPPSEGSWLIDQLVTAKFPAKAPIARPTMQGATRVQAESQVRRQRIRELARKAG